MFTYIKRCLYFNIVQRHTSINLCYLWVAKFISCRALCRHVLRVVLLGVICHAMAVRSRFLCCMTGIVETYIEQFWDLGYPDANMPALLNKVRTILILWSLETIKREENDFFIVFEIIPGTIDFILLPTKWILIIMMLESKINVKRC